MKLRDRVLFGGLLSLMTWFAFGQAAPKAEPTGVPDSLALATALDNLADSAFEHDDFTNAEKNYSQALDIQQRLAPGSLAMAR